MRTRTTKGKYHIFIEIDPFSVESDKFFRSRISASKSQKIGCDEWREAKVNWSAIGEVSSAEAKAFGQALITAASIADKLDAEIERQEDND